MNEKLPITNCQLSIFLRSLANGFLVAVSRCREKKIMRSLIVNERGNILLVTLLIMSTVLTIALGATALIVQGITLNRTQKWSTAAYFAAEVGGEKILWEDRKEGFDFVKADGVTPCGQGDYIVFNPVVCGGMSACCVTSSVPILTALANNAVYYIKYTSNATEIILKSTGRYSGVSRSVEIRYEK